MEKVEPAGAGEDRAVCVAGKRQGPPEDCGGPWGYAEFLEAIGDAQHERHEELVDWIGGRFDPEAFDLEAVNRNLAALRAPRGGRGGCAERLWRQGRAQQRVGLVAGGGFEPPTFGL